MAKIIREALAQLEAVLTGIEITAPEAQTIETVYQPPIQGEIDVPSIVIFWPSLEENKAPSQGLAMLKYDVTIRVVAREEKADESGDYAFAWGEAVRAALHLKQDLNGTCDGLEGPTYTKAEDWLRVGIHYAVVDLSLQINIEESVTYGV